MAYIGCQGKDGADGYGFPGPKGQKVCYMFCSDEVGLIQ